MSWLDWSGLLSLPISLAAVIISVFNAIRDRGKIKIEIEPNKVFIDPNKNLASPEKIILIRITNIGRRDVTFSLPVLLRPDGNNVFPTGGENPRTLKESQSTEYPMNQAEVEEWSNKTGHSLNDLQGLVIDSKGNRWYSRSEQLHRTIKFLAYRLRRKIKNRSMKNI